MSWRAGGNRFRAQWSRNGKDGPRRKRWVFPGTGNSGHMTTGPVKVLNYDATSGGVPFTIEGAPTVTSLSPSSAEVGSSVTINGTGFDAKPKN